MELHTNHEINFISPIIVQEVEGKVGEMKWRIAFSANRLGSWQHILGIYARVGCPIIERFLFLLFGLFPVAGSRLRGLRGVIWIWMHVRDM